MQKITLMLFFSALICLNSKNIRANADHSINYGHWKIIYVSTGSSINVWDFQTQKGIQIYKEDDVEHIIQPSLIFNDKKLLFAKNYIGERTGEIIVYDLEEKKKEIIYKTRFGIRELALSPSEKQIAFLSYDNFDSNMCSLYLLNINDKSVEKILNNKVKGVAYYNSISWFPDSRRLAFSSDSGKITILDIITKEFKILEKGCNPKINRAGSKLLFIRKSLFNNPIPTVYDLNSGRDFEISISRVRNAIWSPNDDQVILVRNDSNPFKHFDFSEWHREVVLYDLKTKETKTIFHYKGFSDISVCPSDSR